MASVLSKLGIKPMEAGLTLTRAFDNGLIFGPEDLRFDLTAYRKDIAQGITNALGLSIETGYVTPESAPRIIGKGFRQAMAIGDRGRIRYKRHDRFVLRRAVLANCLGRH